MFDDDVNWWEQRPGIPEMIWWPIDHMRPEDWLGFTATVFVIAVPFVVAYCALAPA